MLGHFWPFWTIFGHFGQKNGKKLPKMEKPKNCKTEICHMLNPYDKKAYQKCAKTAGLSENYTQKCQQKKMPPQFFVFSQNTIILGTNNDSDFNRSVTYTLC